MPNLFTCFLVIGSLLLPAAAAQAQTQFSIGPQVSLNVAGTSNAASSTTTVTYRTGFEAGVQSVMQFGHVAVQPSLRFSQKGLHHHRGYSSASVETDYRLNYLTLPVSVAYCLRPDGQGFQVLAGPYAGMLLGGDFQSASSSSPTTTTEGRIKAGDYYTVPAPGSTTSDVLFRRFDVGVQAGVGYRVGTLLLQADFALGLRDLAPQFASAYNRTAQVSLSYLLTPKP